MASSVERMSGNMEVEEMDDMGEAAEETGVDTTAKKLADMCSATERTAKIDADAPLVKYANGPVAPGGVHTVEFDNALLVSQMHARCNPSITMPKCCNLDPDAKETCASLYVDSALFSSSIQCPGLIMAVSQEEFDAFHTTGLVPPRGPCLLCLRREEGIRCFEQKLTGRPASNRKVPWFCNVAGRPNAYAHMGHAQDARFVAPFLPSQMKWMKITQSDRVPLAGQGDVWHIDQSALLFRESLETKKHPQGF